MTTAAYTWQTPEYSFTFTPSEASKDLVMVESYDKQAIEDFLSTLELAGPEQGTTIPSTIEESPYQGVSIYFIEVSRATISLFLDFDVRYYMGVPIQ